MNEEIRAPEIRLIDEKGEQVGIVSVKEALNRAREAGMDLVEIAPQAKPPVCKIIDYGKFAYEQQKREKMQKKKQQVTVLKEIRLHPNTDTHDFEFKARHAAKFIEDGNKVKVSVIFKGRELAYTEIGEELLRKFLDKLSDVAKVEQEPKFEGRAMHAILAPQKGKRKNR
ncbi:translation initiation factor IF-3 [Melioribacter roseus P3M-2]|uniref:Translation initiation factor IF-3 n=1 Tax=Melioribacter roseus (strain DSM 23840 / JCM 17771 / VKM B-2668 / P3M-2) TaxID=1191523 RepID=I6ZMS1_MELRP|nr:translation initiation factor IF-3 [Melioribacter roseus]AFN73314.1 translation initiation factor IF-3 [Melioribacter roseus P3M-2]